MKPPKKPFMTARVGKRMQVLALLESSGESLSNCEIGRKAGVSEGTVRYIKKTWLEAAQKSSQSAKVFVPVDAKRGGRPAVYSARCANVLCIESLHTPYQV